MAERKSEIKNDLLASAGVRQNAITADKVSEADLARGRALAQRAAAEDKARRRQEQLDFDNARFGAMKKSSSGFVNAAKGAASGAMKVAKDFVGEFASEFNQKHNKYRKVVRHVVDTGGELAKANKYGRSVLGLSSEDIKRIDDEIVGQYGDKKKDTLDEYSRGRKAGMNEEDWDALGLERPGKPEGWDDTLDYEGNRRLSNMRKAGYGDEEALGMIRQAQGEQAARKEEYRQSKLKGPKTGSSREVVDGMVEPRRTPTITDFREKTPTKTQLGLRKSDREKKLGLKKSKKGRKMDKSTLDEIFGESGFINQ